MDIAIAFTNVLGIRDIAIHVIALVELLRRTSEIIIRFIGVVGDLLIYSFLLFFKSLTSARHIVTSTFHSISYEISEFISDFTEKLIYTAHAISLPFIYLYETIIHCYETVYRVSVLTAQFVTFWCVATTQFFVSWSVTFAQFISSWCIYVIDLCLGVARFFASIPEYLKQCLISLGNTLWLMTTMIPLGIVYLSSMSIYFVGRCCEEVSSIFWLLLERFIAVLNNAILFWSDMPLESVLGLVIGTIAVIIVVKFGHFCLKRVISLVERAWNIVFNSHPLNGLPVVEQHEKTEEMLCVICQDRARRVVSFPCRHMCMCRECSELLTMRGGPCPVCRRIVSRTMTVFT